MKTSLLSITLLTAISLTSFADTTASQKKPVPTPQKPAVENPVKKESPISKTTEVKKPGPIDCNYKISPATKQIEPALVMQWGTKAVQDAFNFDYSKVNEQLSQLKNCFTEEGWKGFNEALDKSGNLKTIQAQKLVMSNTLTGEVKMVEAKAASIRAWIIP